jgi:hypothetical protein
MKVLYRISFVLLAAVCFYAIGKFCHRQTDGFQIAKIHSTLPRNPDWEIPAAEGLDQEALKALFSKPFTFLGSGGQCYAFVSSDGKFVIKLFKMHHLRQYPFLEKLPLPSVFDRLRNELLSFQKERLNRVFSSSTIAFNTLKEETGLLHLSLNPNPALNALHITLIDKLGIAHKVQLSDVPFAIQYRADNAFQTLRFHLKHKDLYSAKKVVREIVTCLSNRFEKGIEDNDPALRRNIGLLKSKAIFIDIGSFATANTPLSREDAKNKLIEDTERMRSWLKKRSPELTAYFDSLVSQNP